MPRTARAERSLNRGLACSARRRGVGDVEDDGDTVIVGGGAEAKAAVVQHQEREDEDSGVQVPEGRHREMWWMKHAPQYFIVQTKLNSSWSWGKKS